MACSKAHPYMVLGAAASLATLLAVRRPRRVGRVNRFPSWTAALTACGLRVLPELLRLLGANADRTPSQPTLTPPVATAADR